MTRPEVGTRGVNRMNTGDGWHEVLRRELDEKSVEIARIRDEDGNVLETMLVFLSREGQASEEWRSADLYFLCHDMSFRLSGFEATDLRRLGEFFLEYAHRLEGPDDMEFTVSPSCRS